MEYASPIRPYQRWRSVCVGSAFLCVLCTAWGCALDRTTVLTEVNRSAHHRALLATVDGGDKAADETSGDSALAQSAAEDDLSSERSKEAQPKSDTDDDPLIVLRLVVGETDVPEETARGHTVAFDSGPISIVAHFQEAQRDDGTVDEPVEMAEPSLAHPIDYVIKFSEPSSGEEGDASVEDAEPFREEEAGTDQPVEEEKLVADEPLADTQPAEAEEVEPVPGWLLQEPKPIASVGVDIGLSTGKPVPNLAEGRFPPMEAAEEDPAERGWTGYLYHWEPSSLCHRPLYFEEINLERYGYSCCRIGQPLLSGAHFFATVPLLPYKAAVEPPRECVYTLGHYRPGNCVPNRTHWMPLKPKAGLIEAGVITGLMFAVP
ncbi:MAG TPA: hypothetical protein VMY42_15985 [Thermoguttaceae bacterium]|nr:hypothetical protein [Thermoguttaceae bacterium]